MSVICYLLNNNLWKLTDIGIMHNRWAQVTGSEKTYVQLQCMCTSVTATEMSYVIQMINIVTDGFV